MVNKVHAATDELEVWGDPDRQARRDLLYIDDLVDMVDKVLQRQTTPYEIFNCGAGRACSVTEIIQAICGVQNKSLKLVYNTDKPNIPTTTILNTSKAKVVLGWEPKTSFTYGVKKTVEWYKENHAS
jgi:nucleoside-diphosphate-sugar epimerase